MPRQISFRSLEALRGFLAVYVVIGHARWLLWGGHTAWLASAYQPWEIVPAYASAAFRYGREAVMVFFVLSGFFIHYHAASPTPPLRPFRSTTFYRRRWHRLAPTYYFALVVTIVCDAIGGTWWPTLYHSATGDPLLDDTFARGGFTRASAVPALALLPSSFGRDFGSNGPLWSLAFEAVYYALYPAWLLVRRRSRSAALVALPAACLALAFVPVSGFMVAVLAHYPIWLAGAFLAEWVRAHGVAPRLFAIGAGLFLAGAALYSAADGSFLALCAAVLYGSGAVIIFGASPVRNRLMQFGEFLGLRSYTIYVLHFPLLALISAFVIHAYGGRPLHGWLAVTGITACVAFACLCFEACERHFLHSRYVDESAAP